MKYWINTLPKDHVVIGKKEGIVQAHHGRADPLKRLKAGDKVIFYSPKTMSQGGIPLKAFTGVAKISDERIDQIQLAGDSRPSRLTAEFEDCNEIPVEPLIAKLHFIHNKKSWGYLFQFGLFEISESDFILIYSRMKRSGCRTLRRTHLATSYKE
jgi:hypothetical protein